jgi:hypothetical protein
MKLILGGTDRFAFLPLSNDSDFPSPSSQLPVSDLNPCKCDSAPYQKKESFCLDSETNLQIQPHCATACMGSFFEKEILPELTGPVSVRKVDTTRYYGNGTNQLTVIIPKRCRLNSLHTRSQCGAHRFSCLADSSKVLFSYISLAPLSRPK